MANATSASAGNGCAASATAGSAGRLRRRQADPFYELPGVVPAGPQEMDRVHPAPSGFCSTAPPTSGATLTAADGWAYQLESLSKQINEVSCEASYKLLWTVPTERGCGTSSPAAAPVWTRPLESAGGSGQGNCQGAERRRRGKRYIGIEDWPGYGAGSKHVFKVEEKRNIAIED
ncbi:hypothetical protein PG994_004965 [Apiospora phragmitis]|uniref:Uncharacterized protein n=1 Tax=Apiospora phragmitis TaxID=2905665 RepID=A0ABR1VS38_9PEZI